MAVSTLPGIDSTQELLCLGVPSAELINCKDDNRTASRFRSLDHLLRRFPSVGYIELIPDGAAARTGHVFN
jgi:hypothetical protein